MVRDFVCECLDVETQLQTPSDNRESDINDEAIAPTMNHHYWRPRPDGPMHRIGIRLLGGHLVLELQGETSPNAVGSITRHWIWLLRQFDTNIPVKLLHGPWTEDRLSFLYVLQSFDAKIHLDNKTYEDIAKKGLMEAITEDNYRAVNLIINVWGGPVQTFPGEEGRAFRIKPNTEHLKAAVIERGCRRNIVESLLSVEFMDIDLDDTAVVEWAENQRQRGDGAGQWLLD